MLIINPRSIICKHKNEVQGTITMASGFLFFNSQYWILCLQEVLLACAKYITSIFSTQFSKSLHKCSRENSC